ncbi:hypothetical protein UlMin_028550, partial [Ulmus minor]
SMNILLRFAWLQTLLNFKFFSLHRETLNMMKAKRLFQTQGFLIIMFQKWAASMAIELPTGVPWVMCKQDDAPNPIINACNRYHYDYFTANRAYKPKIWTKAWTG